MKKLIYHILPAVLLLTSSCQQFLDVQPDLQVDQSQAITNASTAEAAVNGMYNRLGNDSYYGSNFPALSYLSGGDINWTGSQTAPQEIFARRVTSTNGYVGSAWAAIYQTILAANYLLETVTSLSDPQLTTDRKNQILGEAYAVRASARSRCCHSALRCHRCPLTKAATCAPNCAC